VIKVQLTARGEVVVVVIRLFDVGGCTVVAPPAVATILIGVIVVPAP
jgi:hypothetical protein